MTAYSPIHHPGFMNPIIISTISPDMIETNFSMDPSLAAEYQELIEKNDYATSLEIINKLIKRDPLNPELYQARLFLYKKLGLNENVISELNLMSSFAYGLSLYDLISKYYDRSSNEIPKEEYTKLFNPEQQKRDAYAQVDECQTALLVILLGGLKRQKGLLSVGFYCQSVIFKNKFLTFLPSNKKI